MAKFTHAASGEPIVLEGVDTVVSVAGQAPQTTLERQLQGAGLPFVTVGDCTMARSAEEAVHDGLAVTRRFLSGLSTAEAGQ